MQFFRSSLRRVAALHAVVAFTIGGAVQAAEEPQAGPSMGSGCR